MNQFVLQSEAGLANRMRALDSACALAVELGTTFDVLWTADGMRCRFQDLFEVPQHVGMVVNYHNKTMISLLRRNLHCHWLRQKGFIEIGPQASLDMGTDAEPWRALLNKSPAKIVSFYRFFPNPTPFRDISIAPRLIEQVENEIACWPAKIVGVHIRRTDNKLAIAHSPTSKIVQIIEQTLEGLPDAGIFLATDDEREEAALRQAYPDRLCVRSKKSRNRWHSNAIQDALIDLVCLSRTTHIVGSAGSSFSSVASVLGNTPLTIAGPQELMESG